jgi:hypothetical protein
VILTLTRIRRRRRKEEQEDEQEQEVGVAEQRLVFLKNSLILCLELVFSTWKKISNYLYTYTYQ